jgi:hypothetical protein
MAAGITLVGRCALIALLTTYIVAASPIVLTSIVGDADALGTGTLPGGTLPNGPFDNRSAAELLASDGAQLTDLATHTGGFVGDATFTHSFAPGAGRVVVAAVLELGIGGLQSNDTDPDTFTLGEDALFVNGLWITEAFAGVNQGSREYGILTIPLPGHALAFLSGGEARVFIDLNSNAGVGPSSRTEPVFYDYSKLTITTVSEDQLVPEPTSVSLLAVGAAMLLFRKRRP